MSDTVKDGIAIAVLVALMILGGIYMFSTMGGDEEWVQGHQILCTEEPCPTP